MRTRTFMIAVAVAMVLAACGGSDTAEDSADDTEATTATTAAASDDSTTTTAAETTTTTAAETTTTTEAEPESDPIVAAALAAAGTYSGSWTNTTFGSTGDAGMTMTVTDTGDVTMEWDLGGGVFGTGDPDGESQSLNVADLASGTTISTSLFGDIAVSVSDDFSTISMEAAAVPAGGIATFSAEAVLGADGSISGTYSVGFDGGGDPAVGVFEMTRG